MVARRSKRQQALEDAGQGAFDLFGEFETRKEESDVTRNSGSDANVRPTVGADLGLFDEGWTDQQQQGVDGRDASTGSPSAGLVGEHSDAGAGSVGSPGRSRRTGDDVQPVISLHSRDSEGAIFPGDLGTVGERDDRRFSDERSLDFSDAGEAGLGPGRRGSDVRATGSGSSVPGVDRQGASQSQDSGSESRRANVSSNLDRSKSASLHGVRASGSERVGRGVAAVTVLKQILQESREATQEELETLAGFPGWGATGEVFDETSKKYEDQQQTLKELWNQEEWAAASRTIINAHYTDPRYVEAMWAFFNKMGVPDGAQILEPGSGIGNFIAGARPNDQITGVELDPTTAKISEFLHPEAVIKNESFADTVLEHDGFDAAIGNVPFSEVSPFDPAYNKAGHSMHNAFIIKALRMTKPGGLVTVMTSRWTLDSKRSAARVEMAKYGELVGAVRMPRGAHQDIAGTDVIIDTLVFKRHLIEAPEVLPDWVTKLETVSDDPDATYNSYFRENPGHIIGTLGERKGRFGTEVTVEAPAGGATKIAESFNEALTDISDRAAFLGQTWEATGQIITDKPVARVVQDQSKLVGRIFINEQGDLKQIGLNGEEPVQVPKNAALEVKHLLELRDAAVALLEAEAASSEDTPEIGVLRKDLNQVYDSYVEEYGPLGRFTETVREHLNADGTTKVNTKTGEEIEPTVTRRYPAALRALRKDPHFATLAALERFNEDTGEARKATIFSKRVVSAPPKELNINTPFDAIRVSKDRFGTVDQDFIAKTLNIAPEQVAETLGDLVFKDPDNEDAFIPREEYLSGKVREKLKVVEEKAETDPSYLLHVAELKKVIPVELGPAEISIRAGASWIPIEITKQFVEHHLEKEVKGIDYIGGRYEWKIVGKEPEHVNARWGIKKEVGDNKGDYYHARPSAFLKTVMNLGSLTFTVEGEDKKPVIDQVASDVAQAKAEEIHERFQDWLWQDAERTEELTTLYNDLYNGIVLRNYDDVRLSLPGKAATFTPHPHQHAAVARMIAEPSTGLFHEVGAGKTAEMVMGVMELKRLGLSQRPALIVPNHMLDQFTREFKQIYPRAKVLSAGSGDMAKVKGEDGRKLFVARTNSNDWDAVILTHTAFQKIGLGGESETKYLEMKLDEKRIELEELKNSDVRTYTQKKLESDLLKYENALKNSLTLDQDPGITWAETGIDYMCVDEAHLFKNLGIVTRVDDLRPSSSARARDLDMKLWYHREYLKQDRVVTLATATPVANNMAEMFVMLNYLRPDLLSAAKVSRPDEWAKQFTVQETQMEVKPESSKNTQMQVKTRTTKFKNMPELLAMWHIPGDIKTQADLNLPVPEIAVNSKGVKEPELIITAATAAQEEAMQLIMERGEAIRSRLVDPTEDNMLKLTSDGRAIALDARLRYDVELEPEESTKISEVAERIASIWEETKDNQYFDEWGEPSNALGGLQIVFSDIGTPKNDGTFDVYNELKRELVKKGMDPARIRFAHEATNDKSKAELQQQCRDGRVDVIIGSTEKMGVGTNIQTRAVALHHMDPPWRPAEIIQREGRIVRQGNQNKQVKIFRYGTEGSFDSYMWGTLARKARFIEQVLAGRLDVREIENTTEQALQFAEMQAITLGDMRILELANLKRDVEKLGRQERAHARQITSVQAQLNAGEQFIKVQTKAINKLEEMLAEQPVEEELKFRSTIKYSTYAGEHKTAERSEFHHQLKGLAEHLANQNQYLSRYNIDYPKPTDATVFVNGIHWNIDLKFNDKDPRDKIFQFKVREASSVLQFELPWSKIDPEKFRLNNKPAAVASFESRALRFPTTIENAKEKLKEREVKVTKLQEVRNEQFPYKTELEDKKQRLQTIEIELAEENNPERQQEISKQASEPKLSIVKTLPEVIRSGIYPDPNFI